MPEIEGQLLPPVPQEVVPGSPEQRVEKESAMPEPAPRQPAAPVVIPQIEPSTSPVAPAQASDPRAGVLKQVEALLSEGLQQLYLSLPEGRRAAFKQKGEQIANTITDMIMYGKAKVKEIWSLITSWLGTISGVNKYYVEQEIKIKTDRIMEYAETVHA